MSRYIFVYGTLKQGYGNHKYHLAKAPFLGEAVTVKKEFVMKDTGGFPVVFHSPEGSRISGEVYEVGEEEIRTMDRLESNGSMFVRTKHEVEIPGHGVVEAETYLGVPSFWAAYDDMPEATKQGETYTWSRS